MTYSERLKDPRWQKRRLKILERDQWKCVYCDDEKATLHVHHLRYSGVPWNSPDEDLQTVCEDCHYILTHFCKNDIVLVKCRKRNVKHNLLMLCVHLNIESAISFIGIYERNGNDLRFSTLLLREDIKIIQELLIM